MKTITIKSEPNGSLFIVPRLLRTLLSRQVVNKMRVPAVDA